MRATAIERSHTEEKRAERWVARLSLLVLFSCCSRKPYILTDLLARTLRKDKSSGDLEPTGWREFGPCETFAGRRRHVDCLMASRGGECWVPRRHLDGIKPT